MNATHAKQVRGSCVAGRDWACVAADLDAGLRPLVPVGAAAKEHGSHMPLGTDAAQAEWLGSAAAARWPVLVFPTLTYGHYPAFLDYPGSTSVPAEVFIATITAVLDTIAPFQKAPCLVVNTGISTIAPLDAALGQRDDGAVAWHTNRGPQVSKARATLCAQTHGGHADEAETSVMLAIAPDTVDLTRATPWDRALGPGPLSRSAGTRTFSPDGVTGRPDLARRLVGQRLLAAMLADLGQILGPAQTVSP